MPPIYSVYTALYSRWFARCPRLKIQLPVFPMKAVLALTMSRIEEVSTIVGKSRLPQSVQVRHKVPLLVGTI